MDKEKTCRDFTTPERMKEIANNALDYFGEALTGENLYDCLISTLGMTDAEIRAAKFTTLECYMEDQQA